MPGLRRNSCRSKATTANLTTCSMPCKQLWMWPKEQYFANQWNHKSDLKFRAQRRNARAAPDVLNLVNSISTSFTGYDRHVTNQIFNDAKALGNSSRAESSTPLPVPQTKVTKAEAAASAVSSNNMSVKKNRNMIVKTPKPKEKPAFSKPFPPKVCIWTYN